MPGPQTHQTPGALPPSINGWNAAYIESEYQRFRADPGSIPGDLRAFFMGFDLAASRPAEAATGGPTNFDFAVRALVESYRCFGHIAAKIDPFGVEREPRPQQLSLEHHGLSEADLDREVSPGVSRLPGARTLRDLIEGLERTYCGATGVELLLIEKVDQREWLLARIEGAAGRPSFSPEQRREILRLLTRADVFESFLQKRYPGDKRFSLEGAETLIPMLESVVMNAGKVGAREFVFGMAHRGRLNVLNNIVGMTYEQIFSEFEENYEPSFADGGGDVKYHRGYSGQRKLPDGGEVRVVLSSNPSHLEAVNTVTLGRCRAKQRLGADTEERRTVIPVLMHGDSAFAGQGVVAEAVNMSALEGYTVGGTLHFIINNQIGFTTLPNDARSTRYCTDIARTLGAPVFHVNAEDPEACVAAALLALEFRQVFRRDTFLDLVCYRKYGHNEQDEQSFTQPTLARKIKNRPSILSLYAQKLLGEGVIGEDDARSIGEQLEAAIRAANDSAKKKGAATLIDPGAHRWRGITDGYSHEPVNTGVSREVLAEVAKALSTVPEGFTVNPKLVGNPKLKTTGLLESRAGLADSNEINHADAELLAFGTLLLEGIPVRLSGQDVRRGTFSQRHAVLTDFETGQRYVPLNHMREIGTPGVEGVEPGAPGPDGRPRQARFCVYDSLLSEYAVLGFEYGYSLADPNMLVLWEAQFGDFANGAQIIIDQFIASGEMKWGRWSGLVLLLPHGYEGAGSEHSSSRTERFLQLAANDNMQVLCTTTAAQHFHALRRQVKRNFRKPLIMITPKKTLRVPTSTAAELIKGRFHEVLDDPAFASGDRSRVKRVILCSGRVFHDMNERRLAIGRSDTAIIRVEQLYPLHAELLKEILGRYPAGAQKIWVQEETRNGGAYLYMADAVRELGRADKAFAFDLAYIGREACATPASGSKAVDKAQFERFMAEAIGPLGKKDAKSGAEAKSGARAAAG